MRIPGLSANRGRLAFSLPLLAALVILTPLVFDEPTRFDEGFVVSGAMMVRRGWVPVRDFFVIYGPGQFYLLAAMYELFGEDLLVSRVVHAITLGLLAVSVASRTLAMSGGSPVWASFTAAVFVLMAAYADPSASYPAVPAVLLLVGSSFAYERWFASRLARHLVVASLLVGCAALFRWDFGMLGAFALAAATAAICYSRGSTARSIVRDVARALIPFTILTSIGYGPFLLAGDASRWFEEVPLFHAREFEYWRGRPFIAPQLDALAEAVVAKNHLSFAHAFTKLVFAMTPIVLVGATFITVSTQLGAKKRTLTKEAALALFVALLALGLLNQMRVRPGLWQGFPAIAVSLPLIAYLGRRAYLRLGAQPGVRIGGQLAIALVLILIPAYATKDRVELAFSGMRTPIQLPRRPSPTLALDQSTDGPSTLKWFSTYEQIRGQLNPSSQGSRTPPDSLSMTRSFTSSLIDQQRLGGSKWNPGSQTPPPAN
jgi:hypothetical protein